MGFDLGCHEGLIEYDSFYASLGLGFRGLMGRLFGILIVLTYLRYLF